VTEPPAGWSVIINETMGSYLGREIVQVLPADSYEHAVSVAEWVAINHKPQHPMNVKRRDVFRGEDGVWTVQLTGSTRAYYFTATIARWVGTYPH
jgi:hypothetical protein